MEGVVYIAHGSRKAAGNRKFIEFINKVIEQSGLAIQSYGFLENAEPSILQAIEQCIGLGAKEIIVIPVLLLPGIHATVDIPNEISRAKALYPDILFRYASPLGSEDIIIELLAERLTDSGFSGMEGEAVLLVGHGSREREAMAEMECLVEKLTGKLDASIEPGYLTVEPDYLETTQKMLAGAVSKLYVLPFLLFSGGLNVKIKNEVSTVVTSFEKEAIICSPVGFDEKLIPLLINRADKAKILESY